MLADMENPEMESGQTGGVSGQAVSPPRRRHDLQILNAIRQIIRAVDIDSRKLASEHRITTPQLMSLMAIVETDGATTAVDIARRIHVSTSTLVGVLDRLEAKGLIRRERNADDRREISIVPTTAGRELVSRTPFPLQYTLGKALKQLTPKEQEEVASWMDRLVDLMGAREINAGPMLEIVALSQRQREGAGLGDED
jgi:DNA-binding MarR family transcriptional regulator